MAGRWSDSTITMLRMRLPYSNLPMTPMVHGQFSELGMLQTISR